VFFTWYHFVLLRARFWKKERTTHLGKEEDVEELKGSVEKLQFDQSFA
jgi:hypothetical protein